MIFKQFCFSFYGKPLCVDRGIILFTFWWTMTDRRSCTTMNFMKSLFCKQTKKKSFSSKKCRYAAVFKFSKYGFNLFLSRESNIAIWLSWWSFLADLPKLLPTSPNWLWPHIPHNIFSPCDSISLQLGSQFRVRSAPKSKKIK